MSASEQVGSDATFIESGSRTQPRRRRRNSSRALGGRCLAFVGAVGFHGVLLLAIGVAVSKPQLNLERVGDGAMMFASLTPEAAIADAGRASAPKPQVDILVDQIADDGVAPPASHTTRSDPRLLTLMDAVQESATASKSAPAAASSRSVADMTQSLKAENPWTRAATRAADPSVAGKLWAMIKPCWRGEVEATPSSIRLALDGDGNVEAMTALGSGQADAMAQARRAAQAIVACGPYHGLGKPAGSYLVVVPS